MKRVVILAVFALAAGTLDAQNNLVKNPGFEDGKGRPKKVGDLDKSEGWSSPTQGTADFFHRNSKAPEVGAPENSLGYQAPRNGDGYAGAIFYSRRDDQREYLQGQLLAPLDEDEIYCVQFYVSSGDLAKYAINEIGVYFSETKVLINNWDPIPVQPYMNNHELRMLNKQDGWQIVCGQIKAKGGEQYIVIGNFAQKDNVKIARQRKPRGVAGVPQEYGYYYIDDVSVVHIEENGGTCACEEKIARETAGTNIVYSKVVGDGDNKSNSDLTPQDIIETKSLFFPASSAVLMPHSDTDLDMIAKMMIENKEFVLVIMGYADEDELKGDASLAEKRANEIRARLIKGGVNADRLKVEPGNPIVSQGAKDEPSKARVRKVDFSVETE